MYAGVPITAEVWVLMLSYACSRALSPIQRMSVSEKHAITAGMGAQRGDRPSIRTASRHASSSNAKPSSNSAKPLTGEIAISVPQL